jgi:ATP-binding cassette subfamily F protein 3
VISINDLSVSFGGFTLFDKINLHINSDDRIGLTGRNGSGKSTLLKIIAGVQSASSGSVSNSTDLSVGYLPQELSFKENRTVFEESMQAFTDYNFINEEYNRINFELSERTDFESTSYSDLLIRFNEITDKLSILQSQNPVGKAERILCGLGFTRDDFVRRRKEFSVGWNMRVELAKVLLADPDIMLLDEPTNHLDIESISWLENFLQSFRGAVLLISHDRRFLDNITHRTVELVLGKAHDYKVSYSRYRELREERANQQRAAYENQQKMIEKTEEFIEKFRYKATKANQVQSRIKHLEKTERIELEEFDTSALKFKFPPAPRSGQIVVNAEDLSMSFDNKRVFSDVNLKIERGEKVALVGKNGEGKTTFLRLLGKEIDPSFGTISLGYNVELGYYAQNQEDLLDPNDTVFDTLDREAYGDVRLKVRDILGSFLFSGEDIEKRVEVLSGGERARLAMAKLILKPYNLLVLDEPTNHMDIISKEILKQALHQYTGTLLVVSHDRDFLDGLVDKVFEFKHGKVHEYLGGLDDFLSHRDIEDLNDLKGKISSPATKKRIKDNVGQVDTKEEREVEKERKKVKNKILRCEKEIELIEDKIVKVERILSSPQEGLSLQETLKEYDALSLSLEEKMEEWENLHNL